MAIAAADPVPADVTTISELRGRDLLRRGNVKVDERVVRAGVADADPGFVVPDRQCRQILGHAQGRGPELAFRRIPVDVFRKGKWEEVDLHKVENEQPSLGGGMEPESNAPGRPSTW
jgi:hypothetical protein